MNFFGLLASNKLNLSKAALLYRDEVYDYSSLYGKILSAQSFLKDNGLEKGDRVALLGSNDPSYVIYLLALWTLQAVPVPINNRLLREEINDQISFADCKFLLYGKSYNDVIRNFKVRSLKLENINDLPSLKCEGFLLDTDPAKTALILFTSGSTGSSKAVVFSFKNLIKSAETGNSYFRHTHEDIWLAALPFYHIGGFSVIVRSFLFGTGLALSETTGHKDLKNAFHNYNPSLSALVATQLKRLLDENAKPNPALRHILLGGGFIDPGLVRKALENGWNVSKSFGTTETSSFVSILTKENFYGKPDSAGKALPSNKIRIVDEANNILSEGVSGEIVIDGDSVALGYLNNKTETEKKFRGNAFYTGDYGYLDRDGYLYIEARRSDLIVSGGENINPNEVEKIISTHPDIKEAFIFGKEDEEWGYIICAALVLKDRKQLTLEELKLFIRHKLPSYKHPKKIYLLDNFPKTEMGKIQKEKLKEKISEINHSR